MPSAYSPARRFAVMWWVLGALTLAGCAVPLTRDQGPPAVASDRSADAFDSSLADGSDEESDGQRPRTAVGAAIADPQPGPPRLGITTR